MKLIESILTKNPCYKAGKKITVKGLMLHSVGCPQPSAAVFINNRNSESYDRACVHSLIDGNDGTVYQTLPWNHRGWHGGGSSNNTRIGIEMCEPACIKYTGDAAFTCSDTATAKAVAKRTYEAAVELFAYLCKKYNLDPTVDGVIISHAEGYKGGIASNHGDPEHLWKQLNTGYTMNGFRKAVKAAMGTENVAFEPYRVRIGIVNLNIRKDPGTNYDKTVHFTGVGVFTIVAEADGEGAAKWGKLKSGAGWISLDYAKIISVPQGRNPG